MFNNGKYHLLKVKGLSHKQYNFYVVPEPKMLDNFWANSEFTCLDGYENSSQSGSRTFYSGAFDTSRLRS